MQEKNSNAAEAVMSEKNTAFRSNVRRKRAADGREDDRSWKYRIEKEIFW